MKKYSRGFTLIELLVVIAIIGILSSVVLASLNTARAKGADAAIKANLAGVRSQAGIIYDDTSSFDGVCTDDTVVAAINAAKFASGIASSTTNTTFTTAGSAATATCHSDADGWAIEVPLKSNAATFYCVNHASISVTTTGSSLGASQYDCTI